MLAAITIALFVVALTIDGSLAVSVKAATMTDVVLFTIGAVLFWVD